MNIRPFHWPAGWNGDIELDLLDVILRRRALELRGLAAEIRRRKLTPEEREALREVVADEMQAGGGLDDEGEMNAYGNRLDLLIQWIGEVSSWDTRA